MRLNKIILYLFVLISIISKSQVVINEVHPRPSGGDTDAQFQSMYNSTSTFGHEYVELYNTNPCNPVDISCWSIGGMDGATNGGAFSFPAGTTIPPLGFITIGGPNVAGVTFNLNLAANSGRLWRSNAARWHLPNGDGWLSLYDATGNSVDAVYWTNEGNNPGKLTTDATFSAPSSPPFLQRIAACGGGNLATASSISGIEYIPFATSIGQSFERANDGSGTWQLGAPTRNSCNGTCVVASNFTLSTSITNPSCGSSNGSATITANPAGAYTYTWSAPAVSNTNSASNLPAGTYTINVSLNGCSSSTIITLQASGSPTITNVSTLPSQCGSSNGSATVTAIPAGSTFTWSSGITSTINTATNLSPGNYSVTVTNSGCTTTTIVSISNSNGPSSVTTTTTQAACGLNNGTVIFSNVIGGTAPYQFNFNNQGFSSNASYTIGAGSYPVVISDAGNCTFTTNVIIATSNGPSSLTTTTTQAACGLNNGTVIFNNVIGGTAPYQFNFNNQGFSPNASYTIGAGSYPVVISDAGNCTFTTNVIISNNDGPNAVSVTTVAAGCGIANGIITVNNVVGGTAPYQYNFNNTTFSGINTYTSGAGNYQIIVRDQGGCTFTTSAIIPQNSGPTSISYTTSPSICGQNNGIISITGVTGGIGPYNYNFNNEGFSTITNYTVEANSYPIIVQDAGGCTYSTSILVTNINPTFTPVTQTQSPSCDVNDGFLIINGVSGGTAPYEYSFNGGNFNATNSFYDLATGTYTINIRDNNDCISSFTINLNKSDEGPILFVPNSFSPNNDKLNDNWFPKGYCILEYVCYIYNRWGEKIAQLNQIDETWDGTFKNNDVTDDVYIYKIEAKGYNKDKIYKTGHIYVVR
jgi:gliding motility-associated-like protein